MNYIIVGRNGRPSIRAVSNCMTTEHVVLMRKKYRRTGHIKWYKLHNDTWVPHLLLNVNPTFNSDDTIIRWGFSGVLNTNGATIYEQAKAIDLGSNKYKSRVVMGEASVPIPKTGINPSDLSFPIIARPFYHSRGKNFYVYNTVNNVPPYSHNDLYYSEIYPKTKEYRVHVAHGKVLIVHEKPLVDGLIQGNRAITHEQWNVVQWEEYDKNVCKIALDAVKAIGGDMGGVDVLCNPEYNPPAVICEINSAPTIKSSEYTVSRYTKYFDWLFREKRRWFNYSEWEQGKSFAFKNEQLAE